jgi:hypothetical protein
MSFTIERVYKGFRGLVSVAVLGLCGVFGASAPLLADALRADVNDDTFKFEYDTTSANAQLDWNASVLVHDDNGEIYALGANVAGQSVQRSNINGALGLRMYYIDLEADFDGLAIGIGGAISVAVPQVEGLEAQFEAYFAPGVLAFNDLERHVDISIRALYRVITNGSVYLGYRKANVDFEGIPSGDVDDGLHVGIHLSL